MAPAIPRSMNPRCPAVPRPPFRSLLVLPAAFAALALAALADPGEPFTPVPREQPGDIVPAQGQPPVAPPRELQPATPPPAAASQLGAGLQGVGQSALNVPGNVVPGGQSQTRVTTDAGSLLGKSNESLGVDVQR